MNTAQTTSRFSSLRNLGRGIAVASSVALMGVTSMSAADAQAAGVSTGVRHAHVRDAVKPLPTSLSLESNAQYAVKEGKLVVRA